MGIDIVNYVIDKKIRNSIKKMALERDTIVAKFAEAFEHSHFFVFDENNSSRKKIIKSSLS